MIENKKEYHKELVLKSRSGNEMAFRDLLSSISCIIRYYLTHYIILPELRECVLQDILIAVQESLHTYDEKDDFSQWLFYVAKYRTEISLRYYNLNHNRGFRYNKFLKCYEISDEDLESKLSEEVDLEFLTARDNKLLEIFENFDFDLKKTAKELKISKTRLKYRIGSIFRTYRRKVKRALR